MVRAVLADWSTAQVGEKMRETLRLLKKITLTPFEVGPTDIAPLRAVNVSDQAIEDALVICALFNVIDRLADAFEVAIPSAEDFARTGEWLLTMGYM